MSLSSLRLRGAALSILAATLVPSLYPSRAFAQQDRSFNPQLFHAAPGPDEFITVEPAPVIRHKGYGIGLFVNYGRNEFSVFGYDAIKRGTTDVRANLIQNVIATDVWAAFGLFNRLQLAIAWPMTIFQNGQSFDDVNPPPDGTHIKAPNGFALGDPRLHVKALIYGKAHGAQLAVSYWQGFPFGNDKQFGGEKHFTGFSGEPRLLVGWESARWRLGAFFGFLWRSHISQIFSTIVGNQLTYGGAFAVDVILHRLTLLAEIYGHSNSIDTVTIVNATGKNSITDINDNPLELDIAAKIVVRYGLSLNIGVGNGLVAGLGSPQPRVFVGAVWAPNFTDSDKDGVPDNVDLCPNDPEDRDGFQDSDGCPDPDNDADTIPDALDKCPNEAEDFDQFEDTDGCPEKDNDKDGIDDLHDPCPNDAEDGKGPKPHDGCPASKTDTDGDGVPDSIDKCPTEAEDKDGFEDADGCPDPDNDNDGIPDSYDTCPNEPEDMDGFEDDDGCPDPDNDKDGVPDKTDKCPNEPETINGYQDEDGCPDSGPPSKVKIDLKRKQVVILDKIFFDTAKATIKPVSFGLLDQLAQLLRGHAELKIEIQGHTDAQGDMDANIKLSKERAESVRTYLIKKNVEPARMVSAGYGPTVPIADNKTKAGREANRRVEFHIVEEPKKGAPAEEGDDKNAPAPSNNEGTKGE
ncbi:MAG: OmpA/MotB domain protein [Myxococcales bacterium]|nr:OmpA/MotB domain protein [Myxococcales bacterium]